MVNIFNLSASIEAGESWRPPLSLKIQHGVVGRPVGGRRGLYRPVLMVLI